MPGMKFAVLSRCPTIGGKAASFDDKESKKISGVNYVGKIGDSAVAVVADSVWGAMEGRRVLNVTWDDGPNKDLNTAAVTASLKQAASKKAASLFSAGDAAKASGRQDFGGIRIAVHGARTHGAGQLHGSLSGRDVRTVGADAGSAGLPRLGGNGGRSRSRSGQGQRHADGRRLWSSPGT